MSAVMSAATKLCELSGETTVHEDGDPLCICAETRAALDAAYQCGQLEGRAEIAEVFAAWLDKYGAKEDAARIRAEYKRAVDKGGIIKT